MDPCNLSEEDGGCSPDVMGFHHALASIKAGQAHALIEMACFK